MSLELRRRLMEKVGIPKDAIIVAERSDKEAALMNVIYAQGWSASPKYMRKSEAEKVTDIGTAFKGNRSITNFDALQYFTSVKKLNNTEFENCRSLTSLSLPPLITIIPLGLCSYCRSLNTIYIPEGVTRIEGYSFQYTSLSKIELPSTISDIGVSCFIGVTTIADTIFNGTISDWLEITFLSEDANPIKISNNLIINGENVTELETSSSVKNYTFYGLRSLTSVKIKDGAKSIGQYAFYVCSYLESVSIADGVSTIGDYAFAGCGRIKNLNIPKSLTSINFGAFANNQCETFTIPSGVTNIGGYAFSGCSKLKSLIMESNSPDTITIASSSLYGTTTKIYVPDESYDAYISSSKWSAYVDRIKPMSELAI